MAVSWTIDYNGTVRSLSGWGISRPQLVFRSLDVDELTFFIKRDDVLEDPVFPSGAELILRRDDVGWFRGTVRVSAANGNRRSQGDSYRVSNVWASLLRTVYQQQWCIGGVLAFTPRVTLGQNVYGQKISIGRQISEILTYALTKGIVVAPGSFPEGVGCWKEEARDLTCAGAIRTVLKLLPNAIGACDYSSGGPPALSIGTSDVLPVVELDATSADTIGEFSELTPRDDLVPPGVTFIYQGTNRHSETEAGDGRTYTTITRETAGIPDVEGSIVALVELSENDTAPSGAAAAYYAALQVKQWSGSVRTKELYCTGVLRPGKVLNVANGRADWAAMRAVIQIVTENLLTGETTAEVGPPEHLSPQDFIEQQQIARRRASPTLFPSVQSCEVPDPAPGADHGDPETGVPPVDRIPNPHAGVDPKALAAERAAQNLPKTESFVDSQGSITIRGCVDGEEFCAKVTGVSVEC